MAIEKGNAIAIIGSIPREKELGELLEFARLWYSVFTYMYLLVICTV